MWIAPWCSTCRREASCQWGSWGPWPKSFDEIDAAVVQPFIAGHDIAGVTHQAAPDTEPVVTASIRYLWKKSWTQLNTVQLVKTTPIIVSQAPSAATAPMEIPAEELQELVQHYENQMIDGEKRYFPIKMLLGAEKVIARAWHENRTASQTPLAAPRNPSPASFRRIRRHQFARNLLDRRSAEMVAQGRPQHPRCLGCSHVVLAPDPHRERATHSGIHPVVAPIGTRQVRQAGTDQKLLGGLRMETRPRASPRPQLPRDHPGTDAGPTRAPDSAAERPSHHAKSPSSTAVSAKSAGEYTRDGPQHTGTEALGDHKITAGTIPRRSRPRNLAPDVLT